MSIIDYTKELSVSQIGCTGSFNVTLSLTAQPQIIKAPTDIVLILDRSGSMAGKPLANLKNGANRFIDIISESTGGAQSGTIGNGSRIGIVSFSSTATEDVPLSASVERLKDSVDELRADGYTNHAAAFNMALKMLDGSSNNEKVMVLFTDGKTTVGENPAYISDEAKNKGIKIYCIGLSGNGGIDEGAIKDWASRPSESYVAITPNDDEIEELFEKLAKDISKAGATDIIISESVTPCFRISAISAPTVGNAELIDTQTFEWKIEELGAKNVETATFEYTVEYNGPCVGKVMVNEESIYTDSEGNEVNFEMPTVDVKCNTNVITEPCPQTVPIHFDGCEDAIEVNAGDVRVESLGRILQIDVTVKNVCPNKRVALAIILTEEDSNHTVHDRGMKIITIPEHTGSSCRDVVVRCVKFVLPENPENTQSATTTICNKRDLKARFIANYLDNDFHCCNATV